MGLPADSLIKLRRYVARHGAESTPEDAGARHARIQIQRIHPHKLKRIRRAAAAPAERKVQEVTERIWKEREERKLQYDPTYAEIPRFYVKQPSRGAAGGGPGSPSSAAAPSRGAREPDDAKRQRALMAAEVDRLARHQLQEHMVGLLLEPAELDECWRLLRAHASPPTSPTDERINYDDFCQVAERMSARVAGSFFCASHFLRLPLDRWGRISVLHFFQWLRCKNAILRTRVELSVYDTSADGTLGERELEQWVSELIPQLPALRELREEFFPFYKVTAVRKFFFFLDPRRRGRVSMQKMLASPILHELLELRRSDISPEELRQNWCAAAARPDA